MPAIDRGNPNDCATNPNFCANSPTFPRMFAMTGMYMRAMDQDTIAGVPNSSPMWPDIRMSTDGIFRYSPNLTGYIGDLRENSFIGMYVALCGAYDPDPVHAASCRADVAGLIDHVWNRPGSRTAVGRPLPVRIPMSPPSGRTRATLCPD